MSGGGPRAALPPSTPTTCHEGNTCYTTNINDKNTITAAESNTSNNHHNKNNIRQPGNITNNNNNNRSAFQYITNKQTAGLLIFLLRLTQKY
ncbi:hypothetical protein E2C01_058304 [Portunus trituberculatus]|uniref:Uncharacterized protein n=1 Tax=Portunus trituberculatus TaxID=210409 RepID=A0A5B7H2A1_PORTR|nr:hypothetical protein [Portunus trituberculatus]